MHSRTLIRVVCALAAFLAIGRGLEYAVFDASRTILLAHFGWLGASSVLLAWIAWSPAFERLYLPCAQIIVPLRNSMVAVHIAYAASLGRLEELMVLPLMLIGPFFFLGFRFRTALYTGALTFTSFIAGAILFEFPLPTLVRAAMFLLFTWVACAIAAKDFEKWSRISFLEGRLITELAEHDTVTGTKNRRVFDEYLTRLWQQATQDRRRLAILLIDLDYFKAYNDCYGHQAGDQTLRQVAQTVQAFVRRPLDVLARYGGEEFAAILYDLDGKQAKAIAEQMRRAVEELAIEHRGSQMARAVTISIGIAVVKPTPDRTPKGALQLADEALYKAKNSGRNRAELMDNMEYESLVTGVFPKLSL